MKTLPNILILLICILFFSCKTIQKSNKSLKYDPVAKIKNADVTFNPEWYKVLVNSKEQAKNEWMSITGYNFEYIEKRFGVKLTIQDLDKLIFIPVLCYELDSTVLGTIQQTTNINKLLKLDSNNAFYYVLKDNALTFAMLLRRKNSKWDMREWFRVSDSFSKIFTKYYIENNLPFIDISIPLTKTYSFHYNIFVDEKSDLYDVQSDGTIHPFIETILNFPN